jgi:5-methylcytosine-specific restriction enzyme A
MTMWEPHHSKPIVDNGAKAAHAHGVKRSPLWPDVEKRHRELQPNCVCCAAGTNMTTPVQVHHIIPFHFVVLLKRPELELDPRNLMTLCEAERHKQAPNHHLLIGHFEDWQSFNQTAEADSQVKFHGLSEPQIRMNAEWRQLCKLKPKHWESMNDADKTALAELIAKLFPPT